VNSGTTYLQFFPTQEGYVANNAGTLSYVFQYKDHLGNIRLSYKNIGSVAVPSLQIEEENNYYPFGFKQTGYNNASLSTNDALKYKFNGKELQDDNIGGNQLNLYDYGARNYDTALGRWMNIDPLTELSRRYSPYVYCYNNPVRFIDPDGMYSTEEWKKDNGVKDSDLATIYQAPSSESTSESPPDDYVFDEKGKYVRTDKNNLPNRIHIENKKTGENQYYFFADPENDSKDIDNGLIKKIEFVNYSKIFKMLQEQGAFDSDNGSLFTFYQKSKGGGDFDYGYSTLINEFKNPASSLFIVNGDYTAHNFANFGNYLWGATGYTLGYDFSTLKIGGHANSLLNSGANGYSSQLDSADDQRSIVEGAYFALINNFRSLVK